MDTKYWVVPQNSLALKAGQEGFDAHGIKSCCREYERYMKATTLKSPHHLLNEGPPLLVMVKCDADMDLLPDYPGAVSHSESEMYVIVQNLANKWAIPPGDL